MTLHYFIDGYNLIWSSERFGPTRTGKDQLRSQRESLLRFLELTRPAGSERNKVTVVFDGQDDVDSPPWRGSVSVVFSKGDDDADAVIKRRVDEMDNARNAIVVTNDRDIGKWVRASKAKVMSCEEFLKAADGKNSVPAAPSKTKPDAGAASAINEELKRVWKL